MSGTQKQHRISSRKYNPSDKRCGYDRRNRCSEGFIRIAGVGWYCRRYRLRRREDPTVK